MNDLFDLKDKVIVITGAGGVLCGVMAKCLAEAGAKVAVLDIIEAAAKKVVEEIKSDGGIAIAVKCNVLEKDTLEAARDEIIAEFGKVDILINGAGGNRKEATTSPDLSFFDLPTDAVRFVFDLNFIGTLLPTQVFGKIMAEKGEGVILNISSMCALSPLTKIAAYSGAKAAVSNFTQWMAVHMCHRFLLVDEKTGKPTPRGETIIGHVPMGRYGEAEELLGTVLWLLSDAAKYVTGIVVPVDGGFSAFSGV